MKLVWERWLAAVGWNPTPEMLRPWLAMVGPAPYRVHVVQGGLQRMWCSLEGETIDPPAPHTCDVVMGRIRVHPAHNDSAKTCVNTLYKWKRWLRPGGLLIAMTGTQMPIRLQMSALFLEAGLQNPMQAHRRLCLLTAGWMPLTFPLPKRP